jgi:hypothetical protein
LEQGPFHFPSNLTVYHLPLSISFFFLLPSFCTQNSILTLKIFKSSLSQVNPILFFTASFFIQD